MSNVFDTFSNPFDRFDDSARARAVGATSASPDTAAKSIDLSKQTSTPFELVNTDPAVAAEQLRTRQASEATDHPVISKYINGYPPAAEVSNDDYPNLMKIADQLQAHTLDTVKAAMSNVMLPVEPAELTAIKNIASAAQFGFGDRPIGLPEEVRQNYPTTYLTWQPIAAPIDFLFRGISAALYGGSEAIAENYKHYSGASDTDARRLQRDVAILGQGFLIELGMIRPVAKSSVSSSEEISTFLKAAKEKGTVRGAEWRKEIDEFIASRERTHEPLQIPSPEAFRAMAQELNPATVEMVVNGKVPGIGADPVVDHIRGVQATLDANSLDNLVVETQKSKTLARSPDAFEEFAKNASEQTISIPAEALAKIRESDPEKLSWIPGIEEKTTAALETGGDVEIPLASYLARGKDVHEAVRDDVRVRSEGLTVNEAKEIAKEVPEVAEPIKGPFQSAATAEQSSLGLRALFQDAEAAGMTEAQFNVYNKKVQGQVQAIEDRATAIAEREVKKRQTAEWKANEAKERAEVENDLKYRPDLMADYYLRTGLSPNNFAPKGLKLDADLVDADKLPKGFTSKDGVSPSELAPLFGFSSGEALVRNLQILEAARRTNGETPLQYRKRLVEESVVQRMESKYGDLQENIFNEARDLALADLHIDLMDTELRALTEQAKGEPPLSKEELRSWIRGNVGEADLKTASQFDKFQRQAWKASRDTEQALLKGNYIEAAKAKQRQLLSFMLAQEAQKLQKELRAADTLFTRLAENNTIASLSQPYLDQIHRILSQIGFDPNRNPGELSRALAGKSLESFVEDKVSAGAELPVSDILYDPSFESSFETLSVDNFRAIRDSIETLAHNGRAEQTIIKGQQKLDFQQTIAEAVNQVADLDPVIINRHPGFAAKTASWIKEVDASLLKMEQMLRWMDLHDPFGTFSQTVFRPLTEAKHAKNDMMKDLGQKLKAIKNDGKWMKSLQEDIENAVLLDWQDGQPIRLLKKDLIAMMFHTGNESNFKKLTAEYNYNGQKFQWKAEDVNELIARNATKADWDYVQSVWDIFESYWPKVEELSRKMSGIAPDKIEPRTINTPFGDYKGGYAPVRADPLWPELKSIEKGVFNSQRYFNSVPPKGYTRSRTAAGYPIDLSFESLTETMFQMVHDLAFREPLHNATKFLDNGEIRGAIQRTLGPEYLDQVRPWLENLANSKRISDEALRGINAMARLARERIVTVQMMYRAMTALKHGAAAGLYSIGEVGLKDFTIEANRLWLTFDGRARVSEIFKESGEIRNRLHDADRDIGDALDRTVGESGIRRWLIQNGGIATAALDLGTAIPTYEVAYKRALARGLSKEDAIYDGERAVRDAHGSAGKTDLAAIMQGNEWVKLGTVAYTTFSHNYNRLRDAGRLSREAVADLREGKTDKAYDKFTTAAWRLSWYLLLTAIAEEYIAPIPTKEGEHEGIGKWALKGIAFQLASTIPFLRDGVRSWMYGRNDPAPTPISQIYSQVVGSAKDAATGKLTKGVGPRRAIESVGYVLGIPGAGQVAATTQFLIDLKRGQQRAESPNKFVWGLISGKSHPEFKIKYGR